MDNKKGDSKPKIKGKGNRFRFKKSNFSEWYSWICGEEGAKLVDMRYNIQGFVVHRQYAFKILRKIYELLENEVEGTGHEPYLFPTLIPEKNLLVEKEHAGFTPNVFWVSEAGSEKLYERYALRPTGESQIYPMYALWIRSYNDLPFKGYQSRINVFRNEMTTRPFLRGREFMFFETHDVFARHEDALEQIKEDMGIMNEVIYNKLKIPFMFFKRPAWDRFKGADDTYAADTLMPDGKRNQISSTHDLGQNFSKAFLIKFMDKDGSEKYAYQTCFGPGIYRIMAALIGVHGDDKGLVLPFLVAPVQVVIVPIIRGDNEDRKVIEYAKKIGNLVSKQYRVEIDLRDNTPGYKFNEWEMKGVPLRIEIGVNEVKGKFVTFIDRLSIKRGQVKFKDIETRLSIAFKEFEKKLKERADRYFKDNTRAAGSVNELKNIIKSFKGFVKVNFCGIGNDGKRCADIIKAETEGADISGERIDKKEKINKGSKCIVCGKPAKVVVYAIKSY